MRPDRRWVVLGVFVLACVVAAWVGQQLRAGEPLEGPVAAPSAPQVLPSTGPSPTPTADPTDPTDRDRARDEANLSEVAALIEAFVTSYTEYSHTDASPTAWLERARPHMTAGLFAHWSQRYASESGGVEWDTIGALKRRSRTRVENIALTDWYDNTAHRVTVVVSYRTAISDNDRGWSDPPNVLTRYITAVRRDATWKVAAADATPQR